MLLPPNQSYEFAVSLIQVQISANSSKCVEGRFCGYSASAGFYTGDPLSTPGQFLVKVLVEKKTLHKIFLWVLPFPSFTPTVSAAPHFIQYSICMIIVNIGWRHVWRLVWVSNAYLGSKALGLMALDSDSSVDPLGLGRMVLLSALNSRMPTGPVSFYFLIVFTTP